jgi:hypothetical protein
MAGRFLIGTSIVGVGVCYYTNPEKNSFRPYINRQLKEQAIKEDFNPLVRLLLPTLTDTLIDVEIDDWVVCNIGTAYLGEEKGHFLGILNKWYEIPKTKKQEPLEN